MSPSPNPILEICVVQFFYSCFCVPIHMLLTFIETVFPNRLSFLQSRFSGTPQNLMFTNNLGDTGTVRADIRHAIARVFVVYVPNVV